MYGLSEAQTEKGRSVPKVLGALARMPWATVPWWKSLQVMNENKAVGGLNMLSWLDREGNMDRVIEPMLADLESGTLEPVVAEAFSFERAGEAHTFIGERRNIGKVVLVPE
jgi:NADPH:quinone reductase-like Zn-dependent oxidoreductase